MKIPKLEKLIVKFHGQIVGYLVALQDDRIAFQYEDEWINNGFSISPFSLPLVKKVFVCDHNLFQGLYGVLNDSLPSGWGQLLTNKMLNQQGINYDHLSPLEKLAIVSNEGLGALEYYPSYAFKKANNKYDLDQLANQVKEVFENNYLDPNIDEIYQFASSSAGSRPKVHVRYQDEDWIVKFPCKIDPKDISKQEFEINQLAKNCGINVNEFRMFLSQKNHGYFGAKRFDRNKDQKIHMISLSAILETTHQIPNLDYTHLFQVIDMICYDKEDLYEAFKRMCFNVFIKNKDDHSRNFSFLYDEVNKGYKLSPAYDLTSLPNKLEHEMTVNGSGNPKKEDLLAIVKTFNLSLKKCLEIIKKYSQIKLKKTPKV